MGSTGWTYFVPYQPDVAKAFQELRREIRTSGEYCGAENDPGSSEELDIELLLRQGNEGTHSALDIVGLSDTPMICCASPLDPEILTALFGTTQPTREQVEAKETELNEPIERCEARYLIIYRDGMPSEICFSGNTGD